MAPNQVSFSGSNHSLSVEPKMTDLEKNFNRNIRPLLDAVDRLRNLKVTNEGIPLPSIVVVGDQSSGKSSVLESLATISLPRGQGIATRVPLVLRLQSCNDTEDSSITISYKETKLSIREDEIKSQVDVATRVLAGSGKGVVTDTEISLHIRKPEAPDLTMIDLPGITRVPIHGQPVDIYEQIKAMIQKYLKPQETVILNVLSATVDFSTCESIRMSQEEDKKGERTLAVVTKVDTAPEQVYEKVTADDVNIGLGYICVRNRIGEGSHEEAREQERLLFERHPSLSQIDKSCVGIPSLAERLTQIQANMIRMSLPGIQKQIDKALLERRIELDALSQRVLGGEDPTNMFLHIVDQNKNVMQDIMLHGNYDNFADQNEMHYPARIDEMFRKFSDNLRVIVEEILPETRTSEILMRMTEMRGLTLPNFLSPTLMKTLVSEEVDKVADMCTDLVPQTHNYAREFVFDIIDKSTYAFPNLQAAYKQEAENVLAACQRKCMEYVRHTLKKERRTIFTMNDYYMANVRKIQDFLAKYKKHRHCESEINVDGFEHPINVAETILHPSNEYQSAFDMKVTLAAYCKVVHKRMADEIPLELKYSLEDAILQDLRNVILKAKMGKDLSTLMEESAAILQRRETLRKRIDVLKECKGVLQHLL